MPTGIYKRTKPSWNKDRKMDDYPQCGFQEGHLVYGGIKTRFKKGQHPSPETEFKKGEHLKENHRNWKGGEYKSPQGYLYVLKPNHPRVNKGNKGYIKRANLVIEKKIGRLLTEKEIVHHIGKRDDDRIGMLYLFRSQGEHQTYHMNIRITYKNWEIIKADNKQF